MKVGDHALTEESEAEFSNLRRALGRETGFSMYLVLADGPARAEVLTRLRGLSGQDGIPMLTFLPGGKDAGKAVLNLVNGGMAPVAGVVIPDGDSVVRDATALASLNMARDRLYEWIEGPLLIVLAPRNEVELSRIAPDFFDVRAGTYTIEAEGTPIRAAHEVFLVDDLPSRREPVREEAELRALEAAEEPPLPSALADAWLGLAEARWERYEYIAAAGAAAEALRFARPIHYWRVVGEAAWMMAHGLCQTGHLQEAEVALKEALDAAMQIGDALQVAKVKGLLADILQARGEFDEALRIRREQELPVYERLGDVRERAVTLDKVADILYARGEFDEALRIRREEVLPVFERLGDVQARAVFLGKVAGILQARGEFDEALRIRREEVLPVFESLGDVRSLLVGRANLAITLLRRGHLEQDRPEIEALLALALKDARRLSLAEARSIENWVRDIGRDPDAPPFI